MQDLKLQKAEEKNWPYIKEKLQKYALDGENATWDQFYIARDNDKTVAFGRIIDHKDYFELASLGVDYYRRKKGIGNKMLLFLIEEAKRLNPQKPIYGVTHIPGFLKRYGFEEAVVVPEALEDKRHKKCILDPSRIKIMKLTSP